MRGSRRCRAPPAARARAPWRAARPPPPCRRGIPTSRRRPCRPGAAPGGSCRRRVRERPLRPRSLLLAVPARPVPRELVGDAAAARAPLQGPLQGFLFLEAAHAEILQPLADDLEVLALVEGIEGHPQAEALGQRDLLLDRLARMDFLADVPGL